MKQKSIYNPCPICGLPRGKGPHEFAHGKCAEERAKTEGKKLAPTSDDRFSKLTIENKENSARKSAAKRYINGKLPEFMYR